MIKVKRVYEKPEKSDGFRVLIDRLWPRGLTKSRARVDLWVKDISPTHEMRRKFHHDPKRWPEFKREYFSHLRENDGLVRQIVQKSKNGRVTIVYGSKEEKFNNANALLEYIRKRK